MILLPPRVRDSITSPFPSRPLKILRWPEAKDDRHARDSVLLLLEEVPSSEDQARFQAEGWAGGLVATSSELNSGDWPIVRILGDEPMIRDGDVIRVEAGVRVHVLYRRASSANSLFVTGRCNNHCLMCSQPPVREASERWVAECLDTIPLIDPEALSLGITGGEPTLIGSALARIIARCRHHLPNTRLHILTNGRRLADAAFTNEVAGGSPSNMTWAIPLYSDVAARHDYVVQRRGAFEETLEGIYNLAALRASIELRLVVNRLTVDRLPSFAEFVWRNLPFVEHVALMGLEPMGLARSNRERVWLDPVDTISNLRFTLTHFADRGIRVSLYNYPLCLVPDDLRPFVRSSISDWKRVFGTDCARCGIQDRCGGFFASAGKDWMSRAIQPVPWQGGTHDSVLG